MTSTLGSTSTSGTSNDSSGTLSHAKDVALEKTEDVRAKVGSKLTERVNDEVDQRSTQVGDQVSSIVTALRSTTDTLREQDQDAPAKALDTVTEQVQKFGDYLSNSNGSQLLHDVETQARQRPWAVAGALFGLGFAASRILSASSKERYSGSMATKMPKTSANINTWDETAVSSGGGYGGNY